MKNKEKQVWRLLTVPLVAERTGYKPAKVREWVNERRLAHVRLGRVIRIEESVLDAFIRENTIPAKD